jgi:RNA polymerase sigma-70 factor (ECF subfamily)
MTELTQVTNLLIDRAGHGDDSARRELLERYRDYLRRMVSARLDRRIAPRVDASDVVQDTLAEAARRLDSYLKDRPLPFYGWLRHIAAECVIQTHRKHVGSLKRSVAFENRMPEITDASAVGLVRSLIAKDTSPSNKLAHQELIDQLTTALAELPPRDREVLVMRHFEHLSAAEIAETLGIKEGAVKLRLLRALNRIRAIMEVDLD